MVALVFVMSFIVSMVAFRIVLPAVFETYARYSRAKFVVCPEDRKQAAVSVHPGIAAATSAFVSPRLKIATCTLWPESGTCARRCLAQVQ